ncbi:MAG TPA: acetyl-CoA carboxylase carboxyltransferase subunit alpha [bacterium]
MTVARPPAQGMDGYRYDFEKPIAELERRLKEAEQSGAREKQPERVREMEDQLEQVRRRIYGGMTPWQRVQLARHPKRPYTLDYIAAIATDFTPLHGDRCFGDDRALVGGVARIEGRPCVMLGHQKGRDTKENLMRNFGSAHPEGYRKAMRLMRMAEKFRLPVVCLIDTPGAYPGIGAEERGQAHSISHNVREMTRLRTPVFVCIIGEGGSGGALGIGIGDWVTMLENAYYSVISPEGCAAILWRDRARAPDAAEALKLTASDLLRFGMIDEIIEEPLGGAHRDATLVTERLRGSLLRFWKFAGTLPMEALLERRYDRIRRIGAFSSRPASPSVPPSPA